MKSLILIIVSGALINNVVLNQFLGICSFLGVSKQMKASASLGGAVIFVITIASAVASLLYDYVLKPFGLDFMKTIVFILVIAALVQIVEMFLKKNSPAIYKSLGIFLPDYNKLCRSWCCSYKRPERVQLHSECSFRFRNCSGIYHRNSASGKHPQPHT